MKKPSFILLLLCFGVSLGTCSNVQSLPASNSRMERALLYAALVAGAALPLVCVTQGVAGRFKGPLAKELVEGLNQLRAGASYAAAFGLGYACGSTASRVFTEDKFSAAGWRYPRFSAIVLMVMVSTFFSVPILAELNRSLLTFSRVDGVAYLRRERMLGVAFAAGFGAACPEVGEGMWRGIGFFRERRQHQGWAEVLEYRQMLEQRNMQSVAIARHVQWVREMLGGREGAVYQLFRTEPSVCCRIISQKRFAKI